MRKRGRAREWISEHQQWIWRYGLSILGAGAWIFTLWLSSKYIEKTMFWRMQNKTNSRLEALEKDNCVFADRLNVKRHKARKTDDEEE